MTKPPFFSIVVPTYDRPRQLAACLGSLARLCYPPHRFEVIVVDDGSPAAPEALIGSFRDRLPVTLLAQPNAGPATARNAGAAHARGEFLAFTDDDCAPAPDWLQALAARFADTPDHAIGGRTRNALPGNPYSSASQTLIDYLYDYHNADAGRGRFFASNNLALAAARFRAVGGFDTSFPLAAAEDREFCDRWLRHGYGMIYAPEVVIHHAHALGPGTFWRQHFNYGRGAWHFHQRRAREGERRIKMEPKTFYTDLLRYPLRQTRELRAFRAAALLLVSQAANAAGFFYERRVGERERHIGTGL